MYRLQPAGASSSIGSARCRLERELRQNPAMDVIRSLPGTSALVLDSPHSGTNYPPEFEFVCDATMLRRAECTHVEKLYAFAADAGAAWIDAMFRRSYLDGNRGLDAIDATMFEPPCSAPASDDPRLRSKLVRLYMHEDTLALSNGFESLRAQLRQLVVWLTRLEPRAWLPHGSAR
ncbi:MAG: N-formylglutamate amidohydrolase [Burkholderiales bacterium]